MKKLKDMWSGQDLINRIILVSGLLVFLWCLVKGQGLYGLALMVVMVFMMVSRFNSLTKRRSRLYGTMYFYMPDGEIVPRTFEQVRNEYIKGGQSRYAGRRVTMCFPWWRIGSDGHCDTGFGLIVRLNESEELAQKAAAFERDMPIRVTGSIVAVNKGYFVIGKLEELERITQDELYPLRNKSKAALNH